MRMNSVKSMILAAVIAYALSSASAKKHNSAGVAAKPTPPETALETYIARVRAQQAAEVRTPGSIWSPDGRMVRLATDAKAFRIHDVVSVVVTESLAASTDGQVKNSRASNANSGLTSLFGALKASNSSAEPDWGRRLFGAYGAGPEHHQFEPGDDFRRRGGGCASQRNAGGAGHAAADVFRTDATDQAAWAGAARGREQPEPSAFDGNDRPGA